MKSLDLERLEERDGENEGDKNREEKYWEVNKERK